MLGRISYTALAQREPQRQRVDITIAHKAVRDIPNAPSLEQLTKAGIVDLILERGDRTQHHLFFTHLSFQEFLAADYIARDERLIDHIIAEIWAPKWREVFLFLVGLKGEELVSKIYPDDGTDNVIHARLFFAAECMSEIAAPAPLLQHRVVEALLPLARSEPFQAFAVIGLLHCGVLPSLQEIIDNIRSASSSSLKSDEWLAQPVLSKLADALISEFDNHKSTEISSLLCGMVIPRLNPLFLTKVALALISRLDPQDTYIRQQFRSSLHDDIIPRLDPSVFANITDILIRCLEDESPVVRRGAAESLGALGLRLDASHLVRVTDALISQLKDGGYVWWGVKEALCELLSRLSLPTLEKFAHSLIDRLSDQDSDLRLNAAHTIGQLSERLDATVIDNSLTL